MQMKTATSYSFVKEWFQKCHKSAVSQGKSDSAELWRDGLEHLEYMRSECDAAVKALALAYDCMRGETLSRKQLEKALKAAQKILREHE